MIVLSIGAHPDDETCAGGTLIKYAEEGHDVYILTTTRGDAGVVIGARQVLFLPYVDPDATDGVAKAVNASPEEFSASIQEVLEHLHPDVIITHGTDGEYGQPQHIFTQQATFRALRNLALGPGGLQPWWPQEVLTSPLV